MTNLPNLHSRSNKYLDGGGEMAARIRAFDWASTAIGTPDNWSHSLLTTVSIILNSKFPMFLWWGKELIQFYNDAYRPSLGNSGKHPKALGQRGEDCWTEIWTTIKPLLNQVMSGGEATWNEDALIPIYRNGNLEDVYWTFSYSKVVDDNGIGGVLVICSETTAKVIARQKTDAVLAELFYNEQRLKYMLADAPVAIAVLAGKELKVESANTKILEVWGKPKSIIGSSLHAAIPEIKDQGYLQILDEVFTTGVAYFGTEAKVLLNRNAVLEEVYFNFVYHPLKNAAGITTNIMIVASEVTEEVQARLDLIKYQDIITLAIDASSMALWSLQIEKQKIELSQRALTMLEVFKDVELSIHDLLKLMGSYYAYRIMRTVLQAIKKQNNFEFQFPIKLSDGDNVRWLKAAGKAYYTDQNTPLYLTGTLLDITEQRLNNLRKNDFIAMVSHELKTPLTSLKAYVQMLSKEAKESNNLFTETTFNRIDNQVKKMTNMINSFLTLSSLESGKIYLNKTNICLNEIIRGAAEEIMYVNRINHIVLIPCDPVIVNADHEKITQVIINLINNAIKYSPDNNLITITCGKEDNMGIVKVKDGGIGINATDLKKLFQRYFRVQTFANKTTSGFGIGLYLCTEIIERHGGRIWVNSEIGVGSEFCFNLPLTDMEPGALI